MRGSESMGQIFLIFCMKLAYYVATKPIFQIFLKFNMAAFTGDNYRWCAPGILKYVFSPTRGRNFNFFKNKLCTYFFEMILLVLWDSCYDLKWPIYSCFLIGQYTFSTFSPVRSGIFSLLKQILRHLFETILTVVPDSCCDLNWPFYSSFLIG